MNKACPIVLRQKNSHLELLVFEHPDASIQLAKGGVKKGESLENACIRELKEESGIDAQVVRELGSLRLGSKQHIWGFCLMHYENILPDTWTFETKDDGGHTFRFFWQPLNTSLTGNWKLASKEAFQYIHAALDRKS